MSLLRRLAREPLLQFLVAGAALYALWSAWAPAGDPADGRRIVVDRNALVEFMQLRAGAFDPGQFDARFDALDAVQREQLVADYVRDEALFREARALGLDEGDEMMRQRLIQKMAFLLEARSSMVPDEGEVRAYYEAHVADYAEPPTWSFTHVFFDSRVRGEQAALRAATRMLAALNRERVTAGEAAPYGDAPPYLRQYEQRSADYVASHFGADFSAQLARLPVQPRNWQGPVRSDHGWHAVMVTAQSPGREQQLEQVRELVVADLQREQQAVARDAAVAALVRRYEVMLEPGLAASAVGAR